MPNKHSTSVQRKQNCVGLRSKKNGKRRISASRSYPTSTDERIALASLAYGTVIVPVTDGPLTENTEVVPSIANTVPVSLASATPPVLVRFKFELTTNFTV